MTLTDAQFSPIQTSAKLAKSYKDYLTSTVHFEVPEYQEQVTALLADAGALHKGPYLEATPPYKTDQTPQELIDKGVLCKSIGSLSQSAFPLSRQLYLHQVQAIEKTHSGRNIAVVTGTGSGKTECFLIPIINDLLREVEQSKEQGKALQKGVRAMLLYPMNALANDQLARLRELLRDVPEITFGRYTGETEESASKGRQQWKRDHKDVAPLPNETLSREEIRNNPPSILLTNYSMLEYLLMRPKDDVLFGGVFAQTWRHIVVDEAHIYSGVLGTEIGYLLRRLKARIGIRAGQIQCYATSATIGSGSSAARQVASFASDLFGEAFSEDEHAHDVIVSTPDSVVQDFIEPWGTIPMPVWQTILDALSEDAAVGRVAINAALEPLGVKTISEKEDVEAELGAILLGETNTQQLLTSLEEPLDLSSPESLARTEIPGLGQESLSLMVEVLSRAKRQNGLQLLSARYHTFFRAPEGAFINLHTSEISLYRKTVDDDNRTPVYELFACRHCGQAYILGELHEDVENDSGFSGDILWSRFKGSSDDDSIPINYFRLVSNCLDDEECAIDEDMADAVEAAADERSLWLCPLCGSVSSENEGSYHRFEHETCERILIIEEHSSEGHAHCRRCGYFSRVAIQPLRVSPEGVGSIMVYDMVRVLPAVGESDEEVDEWSLDGGDCETQRPGSLICFSDRRQDAAYFAPALDLTYSNYTRRQIIYEAIVNANHYPCYASDIMRELRDSLLKKYKIKTDSGELIPQQDREKYARAWIIGELTADDYRNSLEGLGLIKLAPPKKFHEVIDEKARGILDKNGLGWLDLEDFRAIVSFCLESLRSNRGLSTEGITKNDGLLPDNRPFKNVIETSEGGTSFISFLPRNRTGGLNGRVDFVNKLLEKRQVQHSRDAVIEILKNALRLIVSFLKDADVDAYEEVDASSFKIKSKLWQVDLNNDEKVFVCNKCGKLISYDTQGICTQYRCNGDVKAKARGELQGDEYYRNVFKNDKALPIRVEEHTAQLSRNKAREIQSDFIKGDVNVLSCTTTFELGVDVGDLRAVFLRNMPPSPANYIQRAGRTGRRANVPGYSITFSRLRSHDLNYFNQPLGMIKGEITPPVCYLNNPLIAQRHLFSIAISEYFRSSEARSEFSKDIKDFICPGEDEPTGLIDLREYLKTHPSDIYTQAAQILPNEVASAEEIGLDNWDWVSKLFAGSKDQRFSELRDEAGKMEHVYLKLHSDYVKLEQKKTELDAAREPSDKLLSKMKVIEKMKTIETLAAHGVLPKYGFPTDLVGLDLEDSEYSNGVELQRGLRMAISEYSPGSEVVAKKQLWRSMGINKTLNHVFETRKYGVCKQCDTFHTEIDVGDNENKVDCVKCGGTVKMRTAIIPSYGFRGDRVTEKKVGESRPRHKGYLEVYFDENWSHGAEIKGIEFGNCKVVAKYARKGNIFIVNRGQGDKGFTVCSNCGASVATVDLNALKNRHLRWCKEENRHTLPMDIATRFDTDVLELTFEFNEQPSRSEDEDICEWESVLWAVVMSSVRLLQIPEGELGGSFYRTRNNNFPAILLYDDVPGGAGRTHELFSVIPELIQAALSRVSSCSCGKTSSCYSCLRAYRNQNAHEKLSRGAAANILEAIGVYRCLR